MATWGTIGGALGTALGGRLLGTVGRALGTAGQIGYGAYQVQQRTAQIAAETARIRAQRAAISGGGGTYNIYQERPPTWIPSFNISQAWEEAKRRAESAVNPYYSTMLSDFLKQQETKRTRAGEDYSTQVRLAEKSLADYLEAAGITRGRTKEDVARSMLQIGQEEQLYQTQEARQYATLREQLERGLAGAGLTYSGLGRQQLAQARGERLTETREKMRQVGKAREEQEIGKGRTLADIARQERLEEETTGEKKVAYKTEMDRSLEDLAFQEREQRRSIEEQRIVRMYEEAGRQRSEIYRQYLTGLKTPAQYERAVRIYGNI